MIPELGQFALAMALGVAVVQALLPLVGAWRGWPSWMAVARPAARMHFLFLALAFGALIQAFVVNDFTVSYVAQNSNSQLPLPYRVSAVWGAHEGSLLLWALILAGWSLAVARFSRGLPPAFVARVLGVMATISIGFLLFMLLTSNPFTRGIPAPADGNDLNPLLQDPGLIIHPPMLYLGYVGFSVAFSFAVAALLGGYLDSAWARWVRPWTMAAWVFLTLGIALGSWWAYYELGWGGWWFWDPVENASFMPWLLGTALIHSLAVTEKRDAFKSWTVLLAIGTFALSLLGTFLVRSGVLTSVHAFATDPARGVFILVFLSLVIGISLGLYAWRGPASLAGAKHALVSRETFLLANSVVLSVATATVLLGTLYPLAIDALGQGKLSVGPPYFNAVFIPVMVPLIVLMGLGQFAHWKSDRGARLLRNLRPVLLALAGIAAGAYIMLEAAHRAAAMLGLVLAAWVGLATLQGVWQRCRKHAAPLAAVRALPRAFVGQCLAHIGFAVTITGITLVSLNSIEKHIAMAPGDVATVAGYDFYFAGIVPAGGPNYDGNEGRFEVSRNGREVAVLLPQKRMYHVRGVAMTEAGIDAGLSRDLYVTMGEPLEGGSWSVRITYKPFVRGLWLGALIMALGATLAASDRRFRRSAKVKAAMVVQRAGATPA